MHETSAAILECCGSRFPNKAALRQHTSAFHVHGYVCNVNIYFSRILLKPVSDLLLIFLKICGRVFCRRALLRRHHAVHSGFKEFSCQLCDYATSHKSNLERHMKIHESTSSPIPSAENGESGSSSQSPGEFCNADESRPLASPTHEHNPILASLLSQPAQGGGEMMQWVYHSPYDSYSAQHAVDPLQIEEGSLQPPKWAYDSESRVLTRCSWEEVHQTGKRIVKEGSSLPLRHAIDVILGLKEELPKPRPSWSRRTDLQSGGLLTFTESSTESDCSSIGAKRHWHEADLGYLSRPSSSGEVASGDADTSCGCDGDDFQYVPKKLRMSKRYQSPV